MLHPKSDLTARYFQFDAGFALGFQLWKENYCLAALVKLVWIPWRQGLLGPLNSTVCSFE